MVAYFIICDIPVFKTNKIFESRIFTVSQDCKFFIICKTDAIIKVAVIGKEKSLKKTMSSISPC